MKKNSQNVRLSHRAPLGGYIYFRVGALIKTIYPWLSLSAFPSLCLQTLLCSLTLVFSPKPPPSPILSFLHLFPLHVLWPGSVPFLPLCFINPSKPCNCNSLLGITGEAGAQTRLDVSNAVSPIQCLVSCCLVWRDMVKFVSELSTVVSAITVTSGAVGVGPCLLEQPWLHLQPRLLSLGCPDLLQWWRWICWLSFGGLFLRPGSPVSHVFSLAGSSTRSICRVRRVCAAVGGEDLISMNTKPPFHLSSQTSSFCPNHKETGHLLPAALWTSCTSRSINPVAICCWVVPALMPYADHSCRSPCTLGSLWMEMAAEMHFSGFSPWRWKVLVWQEQGLKLLVALSLWLGDCPAQKDPVAFFTAPAGINDRWGKQGYPPLSWLGEDLRSSWHHCLWANALSPIRCASRSQPGQQAPVIQHATFFSCGKSEPSGIWYCAFFFFFSPGIFVCEPQKTE